MKVYIIGSSGSGKTSYAKFLVAKYGLKHFNSDYLRFVQIENERGRRDRPTEEYKKIINEISKSDNWIFEGVQTIPQLLDSADKIIWLKLPLLIVLYRQWKRFFTDSKQRKEHGFINNLKLSRNIIISQYYGQYDSSKINDPDYNHIKKLEILLNGYADKLIVTRDWKNLAV